VSVVRNPASDTVGYRGCLQEGTECFLFPLPPTGNSTCQKDSLQNGDTCVLISIIVSGSEVDGVDMGGGGFRFLLGSRPPRGCDLYNAVCNAPQHTPFKG
jgi:hypothetical protein